MRALALLSLLAACAEGLAPCGPASAPGELACGLEGWEARGYEAHLPPGFDGSKTFPVILALHGGLADAGELRAASCGAAGCLDALADRERFVVVYPEGTPVLGLDGARTWNAGGGAQGFRCVLGAACRDGVDDVGYFRALLDDLSRVLRPDLARIYVVGFSNGGAMAHRLACELSERIAGVVAVSGANQAAEVQGCAPSRPVGVLQIHGDADPCWPYAGGPGSCFEEDGQSYTSVESTLRIWAARSRCAAELPAATALPDLDPADGTRASRIDYAGCAAPLGLVRIEGGGHVWPGGVSGSSEGAVGKVSRDVSANELAWGFLAPLSR